MANDPGYTVTDTLPSGDIGKECNARQNQREQIIDSIPANATFWRDPDGNGYVTVPNGAQTQRHRISSHTFSMLARQIYGRANPVQGKQGTRLGSVSNSALAEAKLTWEAMALDGPVLKPEVRVVRHQGAVWLDLGRDDWSLIRVTNEGWEWVEQADVPLIRPRGMMELPIPKSKDGALAELRRQLSLESEADFMLVVAWLISALYPDGPFPILELVGEPGGGKSGTARAIRRWVDPNKADLRKLPRDEEALLLSAANGRVVGLDNLSSITPDMADALCRLATGAGSGKRQLFTDEDEVIVALSRPVLYNSTTSLLTRGDLADRAISISVPRISKSKRQTELAIREAFTAAAPGILALLLDGLVTALRRLPELKLPVLPRMADFACLACAAAPAFGWSESDMLLALERNGIEVADSALDADPLATAVRLIASQYESGWVGTSAALLATAHSMVNSNQLPKDPTRLSGCLNRSIPLLERVGVEVTRYREPGGRRMIKIGRQKIRPRKIKIISKKPASQASQASQT